MGLDIGAPNKPYHASYGGLHEVRFAAYRYCGGEKDFAAYMGMSRGAGYDWCFCIACQQFPQLVFHCDCEGHYTPKGKLDPLDGRLIKGNTYALMAELSRLRRWWRTNKEQGTPFCPLEMLHDCVRDIIKNGDGVVRFR